MVDLYEIYANFERKFRLIDAKRGFFGRDDEVAAFWQAFKRVQNGKHEILNFFGESGIGKTALFSELSRQLDEKKITHVKFDFSSRILTSEITILAMLAHNLFNQNPSKFPFYRFRTVLRLYFELRGENLVKTPEAEFFAQNPWQEMLKISPNLPLTLYISEIITHLKNAHFSETEAQNMQNFMQKMTNPNADEIALNLHKYFCDDLVAAISGDPIVIMLDSVEKFDDENWLFELISGVPAALWVIGSENKFNGALAEFGAEFNLEQRQICELSQDDASKFLLNSGVIDEALIAPLCQLTRGVPLFLDICVGFAQILVNNLKTPKIEDFGANSDELIQNFIANLGSQTYIAHILAILGCWSKQMAIETVNSLETAPEFIHFEYERFMKNGFITQIGEKFYMHEIVENALNSAYQNGEAFGEGVRMLAQKYCDNYGATISYVTSAFHIGRTAKHAIAGGALHYYNKIGDFENAQGIEMKFGNKILYTSESFIDSFSIEELCRMFLRSNFENDPIGDKAAINKLRAIFKKIETDDFGITSDYLFTLSELSRFYARVADYQNCLKTAEFTYEKTKNLDLDSAEFVTILERLADGHFFMKDYENAIKFGHLALEEEANIDHLDKKWPLVMTKLARYYLFSGDYENAKKFAYDAHDLGQVVLGKSDFITLNALEILGDAHYFSGEFKEAIEAQKAANEAYRQNFPLHPAAFVSAANLALSYHKIGLLEEELKICKELQTKTVTTKDRLYFKYALKRLSGAEFDEQI